MSVSIDSAPVHANFGASLGGISFPMLADFHPKGEVAKSFGVYVEDHGISDRATIIVDASGIVRHASSIGKRDMEKLAELCEEIDREHGEGLGATVLAGGLAANTMAYVRNNCAASRAVLLARTNLHLDDLEVRNVSEEPAFMAELSALTGSETAPVLVVGREPLAESTKIVRHLTETCSRL
jgi:hypothetical protein